MLRRLLLIGLVAALCVAFPAIAPAATYTVNDTGGEFDANTGDAGICDTSFATPGPQCTVKAAIQTADSAGSPGADEVVIPAGTYAHDPSTGFMRIAQGQPLLIRGAGARTTVIDSLGSGENSVFQIEAGTVTLRDFTVTDNVSTLLDGAGIRVVSAANVLLERLAIVGNRAERAGPETSHAGGVLMSGSGTLTIRESLIAQNVSRGASGGATAGGISVASGTVLIENSTVAANLAESNTAAVGGGLSATGPIAPRLRGVTLAGNSVSAPDEGSTFGANLNVSLDRSVVLENSIVAGGTGGPNCSVAPGASVIGEGRNVQDTSGCGSGPAFLTADPRLGALGDNGGQTNTFLPAAGSAALDAALGCPPPSTDQRGVKRPQGAGCDIGAVEREVPVVPGGPAVTDRIAPGLASVSLSRRTFRVNGRGAAAQRGRRRVASGTTLRFRLSEASRVTVAVEQRTTGRRVGRRCRAATKKNRKARRCVRYVRVRTFARNGKAGTNRISFSGRVRVRGRARSLRPGRYRFVLRATDAAGNRSRPRTLAFRVVR